MGMEDSGLELRNISKAYGSNIVLRSVNALVKPGQVTALLGGNGAGKSTLLNILSGNSRPQSGSLLINGKSITLHSSRDAALLGIRTVHQALSLVDSWAIWEYFQNYTHPFCLTSRKAATETAQTLLHDLGLDIDVSTKIADLSTAQKQVVEITKALAMVPEVLLVDEPTAGLDAQARQWIYDTLTRLAQQGKTVIIVSHDIPAMLQVADHILFLRNGKIEFSGATKDADAEALGFREIATLKSQAFSQSECVVQGGTTDVVLRNVRNEDFQFHLNDGDILAVAGEPGSMVEDFLRDLVGLSHLKFKTARIGDAYSSMSLWQQTDLGVAYVSRERDREWIFPEHSLKRNITASQWKRQGLASVIKPREEKAAARASIEKFAVRADSLEIAAMSLSGGNQQKTVLARAVALQTKVLLLDEPFSGVDAPTRALIIERLRDLAGQGRCILIFSQEYLEAALIANRWLFFPARDGHPILINRKLSDMELAAAQDGRLSTTMFQGG